MAALTDLLAQDAVSWADGGGKAQANLRPIYGQQAVARFWLSVVLKNQRPLTLRQAEINGSPAILFWEDDRLIGSMSLTLSA
jgi:RNA polymerase sigma-70 factor (ECF subfamily)